MGRARRKASLRGHQEPEARRRHPSPARLERQPIGPGLRALPATPSAPKRHAVSAPVMTLEESRQFRSHLDGWSDDVLPAYRKWAEEMPDGSIVAEIGVFHGRSLLFMASECVRLNKLGVKIYGIDPSESQRSVWAPATWEKTADDWGVLLANIHAAPPAERALLHIVRAPSVMAARMFADGSIYLPFIDGAHDEDNVRADIGAWMPKVQRGGLLAGHDYMSEDWHGVPRAVNALIPAAELVVEGTVWSWRIR